MRKLGIAASAFVLAAAVLALTGAAVANEGSSVKANLNGYNEVVGPGSISTMGQGKFRAKIDDEDETITYTLTYSNLENPATQAHIHFAQQHVGGGVIFFLCGGGGTDPCPPTSGTVTGVVTPADIIGPEGQGIEPGSFEEAVRAMRAGATYANVHSTRWPAGEIRGQVRDND